MKFRTKQPNVLYDIATGAAAGAAASWVMGRATTLMYEHEDPVAKRREERVRNGKTAYVRAAEKLTGAVGARLTKRQQEKIGGLLSWGIAIGAGALYGWLRHRTPELAAGYGLLFGSAFFLIMDEGVNTVLGFTPPPQKFPWQAHARGFGGHLVYGLTTESLLKGADQLREKIH